MINISVIDNIEDFYTLRDVWSHLLSLQKEDDRYIFQSFEWLSAWWSAFGATESLYIIAASDENGKITGIVPLMLTRKKHRGLPVKVLSFIENGNSLHNGFILHPDRKSEIIEAVVMFLKKRSDQWDFMELKNIPSTSPNFQLLADILKKNWMLSGWKKSFDSPYVKIDKNWEDYYADRTQRTKKALRNNANKLRSSGEPHIHKVTTLKEYEGVKKDIYNIAVKSWSYNVGDSICNGTNAFFFDRLSEAMFENDGLLIWMLELNNDFIAFEYHIADKSRVYGLRSSYKEDYTALSPGVFLDHHIMKHYFEVGRFREYDLGGSNDFYKQKWTNDVRPHWNVTIYNNRMYSKILYFYEEKVISFIRRFMGRKKEEVSGNGDEKTV